MIKAALKSQIISTANPMYLKKKKKNTTTKTVTFDIPYIFSHLFQQYGEVSSQRLLEEEEKN